MTIPRRKFLHLAAGAVALPVARSASALDFPTRPVHIIAGFAPGGTADIVARLTAQWLSEQLAQPFIVENRPGAAAEIAAEAVAKAPADGSTLLLLTSAHAINATRYHRINLLNDIAPVANVATLPYVLVAGPAIPTKTVPEFISYAKSHPDQVTVGSAGVGTAPYLAGELFKVMAGVQVVLVPYHGGAPAINDLLAGRVDAMFAAVPTAIQYIRAGKLRALGVTTMTRLDVLPEIPTVADYLSGFQASAFHGVGAPKSTPTDVIEKLNNVVNKGLADKKLKARFTELGFVVADSSPTEFGKFIADEIGKWAKVAKSAGVTPK